MSLDWYLLPAARSGTDEDVEAAIAQVEDTIEPTTEAAALAAALIAPYETIEASPYASFPLDVSGDVVVVNVRTDRSGEAFAVVAPLTIAHGYSLFDTYDDSVHDGEALSARLAEEAEDQPL